MTYRRSEVQLYFELMFPGNNGIPFRGLPKTIYEQTQLSGSQANDLKQRLENEISSYYYKSLLSYVESLPAIENSNYSWATVRLYYSVYYACRAYLANKGVAIFRAERKLFYVKAKAGEYIRKCNDPTDHKGTMYTMKDLFSAQDMLQSNEIDGMLAYEWMMKKREEINYKDIDFHDPNPPEFWESIRDFINNDGVSDLVGSLVRDPWLSCFQNDFAILGIPTKRLMLTVDEMRIMGTQINLDQEKKNFVESYLSNYSERVKKALLIWI